MDIPDAEDNLTIFKEQLNDKVYVLFVVYSNARQY